MKKVLTLTILAAILIGACEKEGARTASEVQSTNRVITIPSDGKARSSTILLIGIGHDGSNCSGCVMYSGKLYHVDCMGDGNYCATAAAVSLDQIGTDITATTTDTFGLTSEDFFLMPDRSLYSETADNNDRIYLNIPGQMVYRDNTTLQFTFTGLSFTVGPIYSNN